MFGSNNNTFGSSSFGFGQNNNQQQSGGLFGNKSTFGSNNNNSFGSIGFGTSNNNNNSGIFGNNNNNSGGLFGNNSNTNTFGSTNTFGGNNNSGFGSNNNSFGGNSLFGGNKTNTASTSLFGSSSTNNTFGSNNAFGSNTNNSGGLFGNNNSGGLFGSQQPQNGTNIKYNAIQSTDTQVIKGTSQTVQIRLHAISCMKEYENKSLEELRCEDYLVGRKSGNANTTLNANNASSSGGLFGGNKTTNTFGSFGNTNNTNTSSSSGLFGSNTGSNTGGLFGNTSNNNKPGGLFGSTNTNTSSSGGLFGNTNTGTFGSNTTNTFGSNTTSNAFGSGTTNTFGSNNTSGSLFGNTANKSNSLFGNTNNTSGSLFGNTANNNTGNSLFGNNNTNSGGLFGNTNKPAFGNTNTGTTGGTGLFGNTANNLNKNSFMSGNTGNASGGLFGNTNTSNTGGLFGNTSNTGSLFGNNTNANKSTTSLFGNTNFGSNNTTSMFGSTISTNSTPSLFGATNTNTNQQPVTLGASLDASHIHHVIAALSSRPYGDSPLFRSAISEKKKLNPATPPTANVTPAKSRINTKLEKVKPKPRNNGHNPLFEGLEDDIAPSPEAFLPRNSLKKLVLQSNRPYTDVGDPISERKVDPDTLPSPEASTTRDVLAPTETSESKESRTALSDSLIKHITPIKKLPFNNMEDEQSTCVTEEEMAPAPVVKQPPVTVKRSPPPSERVIVCKVEKPPTPEAQVQTAEEPEDPVVGLDGKPLKAPSPQLPFTLERPEYYTVPGPQQLQDLIRDESLVVSDLVVGRAGYGEVKFLGEVDLWGLNLDDIILFRRKEITVYPDDSVKPPQGQGLNRRAEVTLEAVYPVDKATRSNITDPAEIIKRGFPLKLEKMTAKKGAKFMEYKPETGQWTFMVKHFSKYGLSDDESSDDESGQPKNVVKKFKEEQLSDKENNSNDLSYMSDDENNSVANEKIGYEDISFVPRPLPKEYAEYKSGLFGFNESDEDEEEMVDTDDMFIQSSQFNFTPTGINKKMHSKTALKMEKLQMDSPAPISSPSLLKSNFLKETLIKEQVLEEKPFNIGVSVVPAILNLPPFSKSFAQGHSYLKMDDGLSKHFAYRIGWSSNSHFLSRNSTVQSKTQAMKLFDTSKALSSTGMFVQTVECRTQPDYHEDLLKIHLQHTSITENSDKEMSIITEPGPACLEHLIKVLEEKKDETSLGPALELIHALWAESPSKSGDYAMEQFRKERLLSWIRVQLKITASDKTIEYKKLGVCYLPAVIAWLCAGATQEACQILCQEGDFQLALLASQSSTPIIRQLLLKQLHEWRDTGYDAYISDERIKIYILLAGRKVWECSTRTINVTDGLDWLSAFSLHLKFLPPSSPLDLAVKSFQESFLEGISQAPIVDHDENLSVFWQLLVLYCNPSYSLAEVLNNQGVTENILDERNVWFIWLSLEAAGVPRPSDQLLTKLVMSYVAQLTRLGLWGWAIFIAQHLPNANGRSATIAKIIQSSISNNSSTTVALSETEKACISEYKVDPKLFHMSRIQHETAMKNWESVVEWCTVAGDYDAAHGIFMKQLAPYKILSREEGVLLPLLEPLYRNKADIPDWDRAGGIYYAYLTLPSCLPENDKDLDYLRSQISILGNALNGLPFESQEEQCAVNMMGLRSCYLLIEVWQKLFDETENIDLLSTIKVFPLPTDYALEDTITKLSTDMLAIME